eukprot:2017336-Rhodomonas_salina.1
MLAPVVEEVYGDVAYELRDVRFESVLLLEDGRLPTVRVSLGGAGSHVASGGDRSVTIESEEEGGDGWVVHARMQLVVDSEWGREDRVEVPEILGRCEISMECGEAFYGTVGNASRGDFRSLARAWEGDGEWLGQI